jgi:hypothetical protein
MAVSEGAAHWREHTQFAHCSEILPTVLLIVPLVGRLSVRPRWLVAVPLG